MVELQQFHQLIVQMLSPENNIRSAAEKQYDQIAQADKSTLLFSLYLDANVDVEARSMALVLLRRILSNDYEELWKSFGPNLASVQATFFEQLLRSATDEQNPILRKRLADVVAEVARNTIDNDSGNQKWTGVLQFLEHCTTSESPMLRETGMLLIENVPNIFGSDQDRYMTGIKHMFQASLLYVADSSVRTAAVRAYVAFVCDNDEDEKVIRSLSDLIPSVIQVCQHVVSTEDDDDVPLQCLSDLATTVPKTLVPHFNDIFTLCARTVADKEKDDSYRHSSLEVMVSLCESSPAVMRKKGAIYIPTIIEQCLSLMTEMDDDISDWLNTDNAEEELEEENSTVGETSLDRVVCALGGKACMQTCLQFISQLIKNEDWKHRHAGIMGLSTIGEGCKRQMEPLIRQIVVDMVLPAMHDPHPRVRYAACNAVGQMCTDFAPTIQKKCHEKIVPELLTALVNLEQPRVAAHAGAALVNFSEDCPKTIITVYLQQMMEKMEFVLEHTFKQLLENNKKIVLEQIITTIASVADSAQDHFVQFYDRLIPPLKYILQNANTEELRTLRGKTIECISLIGLAVGRDVFRKDADEVMRILLSTLTNGTTFEVGDDPQVSFLISAWARICKILGEEFAPYLEHVMPAVIRAAEFKPDVTVVDEQDIEGEEEPDWSYISIGDQKSVGIKTAGLEDKSTACEMLVCYARELKGAFINWVEPVMNLMLPMMRFIFHDGVRSAAAEIFPCLLMCAREKGPQVRLQMWNLILPNYKEAISKETDLEVLCELLYGMGQCVEELGSDLVTQQDLEVVFTILHEQLNAYEERRADREKASKDDEVDEDSQEQMNEIIELETSVLARIADVMHYSFGAFKEKLIPYFDRLLPQFTSLLGENRPHQDRQWGICIFDDVIEFGGDASIHYHHIFFNPMLKALSNEYPEVRQASAYGFGLMGMKGGPNYAQLCAQALEPLAAMISKPDARETEESISATENAISAVAKILKYNSSQVDVNVVLPTFISWLPIWDDTDEVPYVYDYFCDLVEANHPIVLGDNNSNLPHVFTIIVHAFARDAFEEGNELATTVKQRLINIIKMLHANTEVFQAILSAVQLNPSQQQALQKILSQ